MKFFRRTAYFFGISTFILAMLGLLYRATYYWEIPVHPGDPYGFGDILDGLFGLAVLGFGGAALFVATIQLVFPRVRDFRTACRCAAVVALAWISYFVLHSRVHDLF